MPFISAPNSHRSVFSLCTDMRSERRKYSASSEVQTKDLNLVKTKIKRIPSDTPPSERVAMTMTLEARRRQLLSKMGRSLEEVLRSYEALTAEAVACLKTEKGYELVSPPKGLNKKYQARTSGKPCGQRQLGGFDTAEEAAKEVFLWIMGLIDTPPPPPAVSRTGMHVARACARRAAATTARVRSPFRAHSTRAHSAIPPLQVAPTCAPASSGRRRRSGRSRGPLALRPRRSSCMVRCSPPRGRPTHSLRWYTTSSSLRWPIQKARLCARSGRERRRRHESKRLRANEDKMQVHQHDCHILLY